MTASPASPQQDPEEERKRYLELAKEWVVSDLRLLALLLLIIGFVFVSLTYTVIVPKRTEQYFIIISIVQIVLQQVGIGLILLAVTSIVAKIYITRRYEKFETSIQSYIKKDMTAALERIQERLSNQTRTLFTSSLSLNSMQEAGVSRVYKNRSEAGGDILQSLRDPEVTEIQIMGVSLKDFVAGGDENLAKAWAMIRSYIEGKLPLDSQKSALRIRVLIIDPFSFGAELRSYAERRGPGLAGQLDQDVRSTAVALRELENLSSSRRASTRVTFEYRLYRFPALLFLFRTNKISFVQPYYFWATRQANEPIPVLGYRDVAPRTSHHYLHPGMDYHFNMIWDHATVTSKGFLEDGHIGFDTNMYRAAAVNVFTDRELAKKRICKVIDETSQELCIQGVTLHAFFEHGDIHDCFMRMLENPEVRVKVLLLNPHSPQACYRAYCQHTLRADCESLSFEKYTSKKGLVNYHANSHLYRTARETLDEVSSLEASGVGSRLEVKLYNSAPSCFVMASDGKTLITEQYHYGVAVREGLSRDVALGMDTPIFEYVAVPIDVLACDRNTDAFCYLRTPYYLLKDNFDFVFSHFSGRREVVIPGDLDSLSRLIESHDYQVP